MTKPTADAPRMQRRIHDVVQVKNLAPLMGLSDGHVSKMGRDAMDTDVNGSGVRGPLDHIRTYFLLLSIHGAEGRAVAVELREWLNHQADEALGVTALQPSTTDIRFRAMADAMKEAGEAFSKCDPASPDFAVVSKEFSEAIEAMQRVIRACAPAPTPARASLEIA